MSIERRKHTRTRIIPGPEYWDVEASFWFSDLRTSQRRQRDRRVREGGVFMDGQYYYYDGNKLRAPDRRSGEERRGC